MLRFARVSVWKEIPRLRNEVNGRIIFAFLTVSSAHQAASTAQSEI